MTSVVDPNGESQIILRTGVAILVGNAFFGTEVQKLNEKHLDWNLELVWCSPAIKLTRAEYHPRRLPNPSFRPPRRFSSARRAHRVRSALAAYLVTLVAHPAAPAATPAVTETLYSFADGGFRAPAQAPEGVAGGNGRGQGRAAFDGTIHAVDVAVNYHV